MKLTSREKDYLSVNEIVEEKGDFESLTSWMRDCNDLGYYLYASIEEELPRQRARRRGPRLPYCKGWSLRPEAKQPEGLINL